MRLIYDPVSKTYLPDYQKPDQPTEPQSIIPYEDQSIFRVAYLNKIKEAVINEGVAVNTDLFFLESGHGLPYGEFHAENISETVAVAVANTAYEVNIANITGGLTNLTTFSTHYLAVTKAGVYKMTWSMSIDTVTAGDEIEGGIMVDNVAVTTKGTSHTTVPANSKGNAIAASALLSLTANQQVSLFVRNHTAARDIIVEHLSVVIVQVGG